jgi:two-component system, OmpR family, response regulator VicR
MIQQSDKTNDTKHLTTGEVAKYCGVNLKTVLRWIERGALKAYQLPGVRGDNRIEVSNFLQFLKTNKLPIPLDFQTNKNRILIIDDEIEVSKAIQRLLRLRGFETQIANDGFKAGAMLKDFNPDLITLDLSMPSLSGFDVIQFIKNDPEYKHIKVLVVSALANEGIEKAKNSGADDALSKGCTKQVLLQRIMNLLERDDIAG